MEREEVLTWPGRVCPSLPAGRIPNTPGTTPDPVNDGWSRALSYNDDGSSTEYPLLFDFSLFGTNYTSLFINNNGNLSFERPYTTFTASSFPLGDIKMVAPFWADVDTGAEDTSFSFIGGTLGVVWQKKVANNVLAVVWDHVGYYNQRGDKRNTFMVLISDGNDSDFMGTGNNVCFCYEDMEWTTGDVSGGSPDVESSHTIALLKLLEIYNNCYYA